MKCCFIYLFIPAKLPLAWTICSLMIGSQNNVEGSGRDVIRAGFKERATGGGCSGATTEQKWNPQMLLRHLGKAIPVTGREGP
jgi:hypothetical protein